MKKGTGEKKGSVARRGILECLEFYQQLVPKGKRERKENWASRGTQALGTQAPKDRKANLDCRAPQAPWGPPAPPAPLCKAPMALL